MLLYFCFHWRDIAIELFFVKILKHTKLIDQNSNYVYELYICSNFEPQRPISFGHNSIYD